MGVTFSLKERVDDITMPIDAREALLASCYTILSILVRDVAIADKRSVPSWLSAELNRYAQTGLGTVENLPPHESTEYIAMIAGRDARQQRIKELHQAAIESGQAIFWPFGTPDD
jgi:hypothetical protein